MPSRNNLIAGCVEPGATRESTVAGVSPLVGDSLVCDGPEPEVAVGGGGEEVRAVGAEVNVIDCLRMNEFFQWSDRSAADSPDTRDVVEPRPKRRGVGMKKKIGAVVVERGDAGAKNAPNFLAFLEFSGDSLMIWRQKFHELTVCSKYIMGAY